MLTFPVRRELSGMRLDRFVQHCIPRLSRTRAQAVVRMSAVQPDGRRRRPSDIVRAGEVVLLVRERFQEPEVPRYFSVVYEDACLLVLDKPAGLPMHRTASYHRNTLTYLLRERYGLEAPPRVAHRLDRETSGLVVCVKDRVHERAVQHAFEQHRVQKRYLAVVCGVPAPPEGLLRFSLAPVESGLHVCMEVRPEGQGLSSETWYRVRARRGSHALVELRPRTGRQHQLRVHLAAGGTPIVGDKLYGPEGSAPFLEIIESGLSPSLVERLGHPRQALHAHGLTMPHPRDGRPVSFTAPIPQDLRVLWSRL